MVGVRFPKDSIAQIDEWASAQAMSRSEAIRRLVEIGLAAPAVVAVTEPEDPRDQRRRQSEAMKAYNRKTGKGTALGNTVAKRRKPPA